MERRVDGLVTRLDTLEATMKTVQQRLLKYTGGHRPGGRSPSPNDRAVERIAASDKRYEQLLLRVMFVEEALFGETNREAPGRLRILSRGAPSCSRPTVRGGARTVASPCVGNATSENVTKNAGIHASTAAPSPKPMDDMHSLLLFQLQERLEDTVGALGARTLTPEREYVGSVTRRGIPVPQHGVVVSRDTSVDIDRTEAFQRNQRILRHDVARCVTEIERLIDGQENLHDRLIALQNNYAVFQRQMVGERVDIASEYHTSSATSRAQTLEEQVTKLLVLYEQLHDEVHELRSAQEIKVKEDAERLESLHHSVLQPFAHRLGELEKCLCSAQQGSEASLHTGARQSDALLLLRQIQKEGRDALAHAKATIIAKAAQMIEQAVTPLRETHPHTKAGVQKQVASAATGANFKKTFNGMQKEGPHSQVGIRMMHSNTDVADAITTEMAIPSPVSAIRTRSHPRRACPWPPGGSAGAVLLEGDRSTSMRDKDGR